MNKPMESMIHQLYAMGQSELAQGVENVLFTKRAKAVQSKLSEEELDYLKNEMTAAVEGAIRGWAKIQGAQILESFEKLTELLAQQSRRMDYMEHSHQEMAAMLVNIQKYHPELMMPLENEELT